MRRFGIKLLKVSIVISLSAIILLLPIVLLLSNLEQERLILVLKILFAIIFGFGLLSIIMMKMGCMSFFNENNRTDSPIKVRFDRLGPVIMKVSAFLCATFFALIFIFTAMSFYNEPLFVVAVKYSFILSVIFGTISFLCLLFCSPRPKRNCEKYCISYKDFSDFYYNFSNSLKKQKFKLHGCTTTKHGNKIFIYRKKFFSVDYCFIVKVTANQDCNFLDEVHKFCYEFLKKELPFNFGTITANNIFCFENNSFSYAEESYINSTVYRRWTNFYVGISFPKNEIRLCNSYDVYRTHSINRMKRNFIKLFEDNKTDQSGDGSVIGS